MGGEGTLAKNGSGRGNVRARFTDPIGGGDGSGLQKKQRVEFYPVLTRTRGKRRAKIVTTTHPIKLIQQKNAAKQGNAATEESFDSLPSAVRVRQLHRQNSSPRTSAALAAASAEPASSSPPRAPQILRIHSDRTTFLEQARLQKEALQRPSSPVRATASAAAAASPILVKHDDRRPSSSIRQRKSPRFFLRNKEANGKAGAPAASSSSAEGSAAAQTQAAAAGALVGNAVAEGVKVALQKRSSQPQVSEQKPVPGGSEEKAALPLPPVTEASPEPLPAESSPTSVVESETAKENAEQQQTPEATADEKENAPLAPKAEDAAADGSLLAEPEEVAEEEASAPFAEEQGGDSTAVAEGPSEVETAATNKRVEGVSESFVEGATESSVASLENRKEEASPVSERAAESKPSIVTSVRGSLFDFLRDI